MSTQAYINRQRIIAEASVTKIQYPKGVASINKLAPTIDCNPKFDILDYKHICQCPSIRSSIILHVK